MGITTQLVTSCYFALARVPPDLLNINVAVNCELLPMASDSIPGDWELSLANNPPNVQFLGDMCEFLTLEGAERIDVLFGCSSTI